VLVVVPRHELAEGVVQRDARVGVEDGRARVVDEVRGHDLVLRVWRGAGCGGGVRAAARGREEGAGRPRTADDALVLGRLRRGLHDGLDPLVGRGAREAAGQVHDGHVGRGHAEGHARELAGQRGDDLAAAGGGGLSSVPPPHAEAHTALPSSPKRDPPRPP